MDHLESTNTITCEICQEEIPQAKVEKCCRKGRFVCAKCWGNKANAKYRKHWFVKSLKYDKPTINAIRPRKPLPGQMELFDEEQS